MEKRSMEKRPAPLGYGLGAMLLFVMMVTNMLPSTATASTKLPPAVPSSQWPLSLSTTSPQTGPYYQLEIPLHVLSHPQLPSPHRLQVVNSQGQAVPMAWLPNGPHGVGTLSLEQRFEQRIDQRPVPDPTANIVRSLKLPLFPIPDEGGTSKSTVSGDADSKDLSIGFKLKPDGSLQPVLRATSAANPAASSSTAPPTSNGRRAPEAPAPSRWLVDLRSVQQALQAKDKPLQLHALTVQLEPGASGLFSLSLQASDDLRQWRNLTPDHAPVRLVKLQHNGAHLEELSIAAHTWTSSGAAAGQSVPRYLQLHWLKTTPPGLVGLTAQLSASANQYRNPAQSPQGSTMGPTDKASASAFDLANNTASTTPHTARHWTATIAPSRCDQSWCDFDLPANVPIEQIDIRLGQPNSLVPLTVYGIRPRGATQEALRESSPPPHSHNPLKILHRKTGETQRDQNARRTDDGQALHRLGQHTAYWLHADGQELRSAVLTIQAGAYQTRRLQAASPTSELAALAPTVKIGTTPPRLIWLAQGPAPFALQISTPSATSSAVALDTLIPRARDGERLPLYLGWSQIQEQAPPATGAPSAVPPAPPIAEAASVSTRQAVLWGSLVAALLVLGFMARSVLAGLKNPDSPNHKPET